MQEIVLSNNILQLGILPDFGASVSFLTYKGRNILRPAEKTSPHFDANQSGMFVMVPFCGRIRGGRFIYWGITRKMKKNHIGISDPIHGDGWKSVWSVSKKSDNSVTLTLTHNKENGFPFSYQAELTYTLNDNNLDISLTLLNPEVLPMPCGIGIHPFFQKTKDMTIKFPSKMIWAHETDPIFDKPYPTPFSWQFKDGLPLNTQVFDTCFGGFDGQASITYPSEKYQINISAGQNFGHIVLYAPKNKNFVCLEPCTNAPNAFNLASNGVIGSGIKSIAQNQELHEHIRINISDLSE